MSEGIHDGFCKICRRIPSLPCRWEACPLYKVIEMTDRDFLLQEREKTHGSFKDNAAISQALKTIMHSPGSCNIELRSDSIGSYSLLSIQREALDMIALKLSRILSGQANFKDHWDDIAGYAKLGAEACEK